MINSKILWSYDKNRKIEYLPISILFDLISIGFGLSELFLINGITLNNATSLFTGIGFILIGITHFYFKTRNYIYSETVKYILTEKEVQFQYGLIKKKTESIPYNTILKVTKIEETKSDSISLTIHSTTKIKFKGFDKTFKELRSFPSFDRIPNGGLPLDILKARIATNNFNKLRSQLNKELLGNELSSSHSPESRKWNLNLAYLYLLMVLLVCTAFVDINFLEMEIIDDKITSCKRIYNDEGKGIFIRCQTENGNNFGAYDLKGKIGHEIMLHKSQIFRLVCYTEWRGKNNNITNPTMVNGMIIWIFPIFAIYFLMTGIQIIYNKGKIKQGDRGFLYIGPICTLFLMHIALNLSGV